MLAALAFVGFGCVARYNANEAWAAAALGLTRSAVARVRRR